MEQRPNFYTILELDTTIVDWPTIEAKIKAKQREWSKHKNQGSPAQRRKAERYLKLIPDMTLVLQDAQTCEQERKAYIKAQKTEKQAASKQLDDLIKNIHTDTASAKLIKTLIRETGKIFTEKEVEDRLRKNGIEPDNGQSKKTKKTTKPVLDASLTKTINAELQTLNVTNLYDFLNLDHSPRVSERSSVKSLYERADDIYKELSRVGKTDADTTLKMGLAGHAKSVFSNENDKVKYDNTRAAQALGGLDSYLEIAGDDKYIDAKEIQSLVKVGKKLGIDHDTVLDYVEAFATKRKWGVQQQTSETKCELLVCGFCGELATSINDKRCKHCGEELIQPCPKCHELIPTEDAACHHCGCHTGDAPVVHSWLKEGLKYYSLADYDSAIDCFDRGLDFWADWQQLIDEKQKAQGQKKQVSDSLNDLKLLVKQRKLEAAEVKLNTFIQRYGERSTDTLSKQVQDGLNKANACCVAAQSLSAKGQSELAFDKYSEALSYCVDYSVAISLMAKTPPPAPEQISSSWVGQTIRLQWSKSKARGDLNYQLVRKVDGIPLSANDGEVLATTSATQLDDTQLVPGVAYFYAVFTLRAGVSSKDFAQSGPHLLASDVEHLNYQSGDSEITLSWQLPNKNSAVEVWRREGLAPSKRGEGKKLVVSGQSVVDRSLENERRYGYLVVVRYTDPQNANRFIYSKGTSIVAAPASPPPVINDLKVTRHGNVAFLSWTPIAGDGYVEIRQTQNLPEFSPGQLIGVNDADQFGVLLPNTNSGSAQANLSVQGRVYFTPLSIKAQTMVLGHSVAITTLDDVTHLVSRRSGNKIILTWQWPVGATEVLIAYHSKSFPSEPHQDGATTVCVTKTEYDSDNFWSIRKAERIKYYFSVFVNDPLAGVYSMGANVLEAMGQELSINYKVVLDKSWFSRTPRQGWVEFKCSQNIVVDGLLMVMKAQQPPVSKSDGMVIKTINQLNFIGGVAREAIPAQYLKRNGYIKIFFQDDRKVQEVRLMPTAKDKLYVG